jgi:hypothetical protein
MINVTVCNMLCFITTLRAATEHSQSATLAQQKWVAKAIAPPGGGTHGTPAMASRFCDIAFHNFVI